jgi:RNA polymerase sigma-70 factor (ECF subfamily)
MVYCVVPSTVAARVRRSIERGLSGRQGIEVLPEGRSGERRTPGDRRERADVREPWSERRCVRYAEGRRVADRRAGLVPVEPPPNLPRAVRANISSVAFVESLDVPAELREDVEAVRAIIRFQSGERDLAELYSRWIDAVYTYLHVTLDRDADVETYVSHVLSDALRDARDAAPAPGDVRPWLFGIAHRRARSSSLERPRPTLVGGHALAEAGAKVRMPLDWISDDDLVLLIERRPPAERHLLVLRYFAGLSLAEVAAVMELGDAEAAALHNSAVMALDASLSAVNRGPRVEERHPMGRLSHQTPVLHQRRRALLAV